MACGEALKYECVYLYVFETIGIAGRLTRGISYYMPVGRAPVSAATGVAHLRNEVPSLR